MHYTTVFLFFNDTATTDIYTLSLHDALPIWLALHFRREVSSQLRAAHEGVGNQNHLVFRCRRLTMEHQALARNGRRSEEHTSELQSHHDLVCRLLLEKKKNK